MQMETTCHCLCGAWLKTPPATVFCKPGHASCKSTFQLNKGGCLRGAAYASAYVNLRLFVAGRSLVYRLNRVGASTELGAVATYHTIPPYPSSSQLQHGSPPLSYPYPLTLFHPSPTSKRRFKIQTLNRKCRPAVHFCRGRQSGS
jgi:hypothetical protein